MLARPQFLRVVFSLWVIISILEILRLHTPAGRYLSDRFAGGLLREHERSHFSGAWWMLLGVMASGFLLDPFRLAATPILYLLLGDTAASLVGIQLKGPRWPGSQKSISGSFGCFFVCVIVGFVLLKPSFGWSLVFMGAFAATFFEMNPLRLNDNLLIPLGSALIIRLWI